MQLGQAFPSSNRISMGCISEVSVQSTCPATASALLEYLLKQYLNGLHIGGQCAIYMSSVCIGSTRLSADPKHQLISFQQCAVKCKKETKGVFELGNDPSRVSRKKEHMRRPKVSLVEFGMGSGGYS